MTKLFTIGHSNRTIDELVMLLKRSEVNAIADVRSSPFSRHTPQFNRAELESSLKSQGLKYVFLGDELGARRRERDCYINGVADYDLIRDLPLFQQGLSRVLNGLQKMSIALMCAERDPLTCHRAILVARALKPKVHFIEHIIGQDTMESHDDLESRLLQQYKTDGNDLFSTRDDLIDKAYKKRGSEIAYAEESQQ